MFKSRQHLPENERENIMKPEKADEISRHQTSTTTVERLLKAVWNGATHERRKVRPRSRSQPCWPPCQQALGPRYCEQ